MTFVEILLAVGLTFCLIAVVMTIINLRIYARPPAGAVAPSPTSAPADQPMVSVCIPARNEEANLGPCVRSLLACDLPNIEVLVYNDQSTDATGRILAELINADPRVRSVPTIPLPDGWNGKQHGCHQMGRAARGQWLLFTDADVRFQPTALSATLAAAAQRPHVALWSTFPQQLTGSLAERLIVPLIHFILFSYLPMPRMRTTADPAASAGCGQFLFVRRDAWSAAGGHAAFKASMHDGIKLPRAIRASGAATDLFDGTHLCSVRMYRGLAQTWRGFTKNAFEGLGSVGLLVFVTIVHALGHVLPWLYLAWAALHSAGMTVPGLEDAAPTRTGLLFAAIAVAVTLFQRSMLAVRFRQAWVSVLLHPVGVTLMTVIQWHSLYLAKTGRRAWRGRTQGVASA